MALRNPFKLEKLTITAFRSRERRAPVGEFEVMFNPSSFSMNRVNVFQKDKGVGAAGGPAHYSHSRSGQLALKFVLDGTGTSDFGVEKLLGLGTDTVAEQVDRFFELCVRTDSELHEPKFLRINWGDGELRDFDCRVSSVDVNYTAFEKSGAPLTAELDVRFVEDVAADKQNRQLDLRSPDVDRVRVVKAGDSLPQLCREIYGSSSHYLFVARANELDDFRNLSPGQEVRFPRLSR